MHDLTWVLTGFPHPSGCHWRKDGEVGQQGLKQGAQEEAGAAGCSARMAAWQQSGL